MTTVASESARRFASLTESLHEIEQAVAHASQQQSLQREQEELFEEELQISYDVNRLLSEADTGRRILANKGDEQDFLSRERQRTQQQLQEALEETAYLQRCVREPADPEEGRRRDTLVRLHARVAREEQSAADARTEVLGLRDALELAQDRLDAARLGRDRLASEVDNLEREHQEMRRILASAQGKVETLKQESSFLKYELRRQKEDLTLAESDLEIVLKKLHQLENECESLTKENFSLKQDISLLGEQDSFAGSAND